jgi:sugar-specific transcriptional regulator TrmB
MAALREEALKDPRSVIAEAAARGVGVLGRIFEIADASGAIILRVPFHDAVIREHQVEWLS